MTFTDIKEVIDDEETCDQCNQPMSEHDDGECPKMCERMIEGYKDLTFEQSAYIFDTMCEATKEN